MDKIFCYLAAKILISLPSYLGFSLLKRLEAGVYLFCRRQWLLYLQLPISEVLKNQAISEFNHAQALALLSNSKLEISAKYLINRPDADTWNRLEWDNRDWGEPLDGISVRYLTTKIFFNGRTANSYELADKLGFMCVLEHLQTEFYSQLIKVCSSRDKAKLIQIQRDEAEHADSLLLALKEASPNWRSLLWKWRIRKYLA